MAIQSIEKRNRTLATVVLFLPALLQAFPVFYIVCISLMGRGEIYRFPPNLLPAHPGNLENYAAALDAAPLMRFLANSLIVAGGITLLQVLTAVLAAYALARLRFTGARLVLGLVLATLMVPGEVTVIPNYLLLARLGWLDTYRALILPFSVSGFGIFLLYQFMRSIPRELEEAAMIDGASRLRFLLQFAVPLSAPAIAAFAAYAFVSAWNQYLWPLVATQSTAMQTAQIGIGIFRSQNESMSWGVVMAATVMMISPTVLVFVATQKQFVAGISASGLKG